MKDVYTELFNPDLLTSSRQNDKGNIQRIPKTVLALIMGVMSILTWAKSDLGEFSIGDALSQPEAKQKLGNDIAFYFGDQKYGEVIKSLGEVATNNKLALDQYSPSSASSAAMSPGGLYRTMGTDRSALTKKGCMSAFIEALLVLQERTLQGGGNAIVNIKSNSAGEETIDQLNNNTFTCALGMQFVGVALKGTAVKLAK